MSRTVRKLHRVIGIVLLLPFLGWAVTGAIFFIKPGYGAAYDALAVKTYPMESPLAVQPDPAWREVRYLRTILGPHLIARTGTGWAQLNPATLQPARAPSDDDIKRLVADAVTANPARYGHIISLADRVVTTDTGAVITVDWNRLALQQRGRDTDRIDGLYRIHYLQWSGEKTIDKVLGLAGLTLLVALTILGARLALT